MPGKILVCLDGSERAEAILQLAVDLSNRLDAGIVLLRVNQSPEWLSGLGQAEIEPRQSTEISEREFDIDSYLECIAGVLWEKRADVECAIVEGPVGESIVAFARKHEVSLIAMATRGYGRLGKFIMGSVADYVLRESEVPVILMGPAAVKAGSEATGQPKDLV